MLLELVDGEFEEIRVLPVLSVDVGDGERLWTRISTREAVLSQEVEGYAQDSRCRSLHNQVEGVDGLIDKLCTS